MDDGRWPAIEEAVLGILRRRRGDILDDCARGFTIEVRFLPSRSGAIRQVKLTTDCVDDYEEGRHIAHGRRLRTRP